MSKKTSALSSEEKEWLAVQIVAASEGIISVPKAMKEVGFDTPTRKNTTISKRVYRTSKNMVVVKEKPGSAGSISIPSTRVATVVGASVNSSVSSLSNPPSNRARGRATRQSIDTPESIKRTLPLADPPPKKRRRTSKQKNQDDAAKAMETKKQNHAIKMVTKKIAFAKTVSPSHPYAKMPQRDFVADANKSYNTNVSHKTVSKMLREGRIGISPQKRGPPAAFPKFIWEAMKLAFVTYLQLEQAHSKVQSTVKQLSLRVNQMVRMAGHSKTGND